MAELNDFALQQVLLTPCVVTQELQLRFLRVRVVDCRIDLRGRKIAPRSQLGSIQLRDQLALVQMIALPGKNLFHAPSGARSHVCLIHLDRSRNRVASIPAIHETDRQYCQDYPDEPGPIVDFISHGHREGNWISRCCASN